MSPNVTETLSPQSQRILDLNQQAKEGYGQLANSQIAKLKTTLQDPFTFNDNSHTQWATGLYNKINGQTLADQQESTRARLSNMGISMGTPAYDREISRLEKSQGAQRDQFLLDSYGQDLQSQLATRNQNVNESTALASGGQVSQPNFGVNRAGNVATTDNAGIINQDYQNRLAAHQANGANIGGVLSGVGSLFALSDERAKKNIHKVGKANGHNVYEYEYKKGMGPHGIQMGLIAQEVERKKPSAVVKGADGMRRVNYPKALGLRMGA